MRSIRGIQCVFLKKNALVLVGVLLMGLVSISKADFIQVTTSTSAPQGLGSMLVAATTNQFLASVVKNPLASGTYAIKLFGINPEYNAPPSTLEQALSLGSTVYVYGFADGQSYERHRNLITIGNYVLNLGTSNVECQQYMGTLQDEIYTQNFSTPTVIPPPGGF